MTAVPAESESNNLPPRLRRGGKRFLRNGVVTAFAILAALISFYGANRSQSVPDNWPQTEAGLRALLSGNSEQKRTALGQIRNLRTEQASRLAVAALRDSDEMVRATAAAAVIYLPKDEAAALLLPLLDDKRPFVRREAAYAAGETDSVSTVAKLGSLAASDRDLEVRSAAAVGLGRIGNPAALNNLIQILRKRPTEKEEFIRRSSARAVGQIFDALNGRCTYTITPQNFLPPKFKDVGSSKPDLSQLNVNEIVSVLSRVLENSAEADDTRREAAYALGATRQSAAVAILNLHVKSSDPYLAEISKEALLKVEASGNSFPQ